LDKTAAGTKVVRGESAFRLYDTYGLPLDFIEDMIEERKLSFDRDGFERAMEQQREKARAGSKFKGGARDEQAFAGFANVPATTFSGYDSASAQTRVLALARLRGDEPPVEGQKLSKGDTGWIGLERAALARPNGA